MSLSPSLSLSLLFTLVASWHLNVNLLHPGTLCVSRHPLLLILLLHMFGSAMIKQIGLFEVLDEPFIRNAKSFCRTSPTLTYPLSFTVGVGSHCVTAQSLVYPCLFKSSTPTCKDLIIQCLSLLPAFEVSEVLCVLRVEHLDYPPVISI